MKWRKGIIPLTLLNCQNLLFHVSGDIYFRQSYSPFFFKKMIKKKHFSSFLIPLVVHLSTRNFFLSSDMSENYVKLLCRVYCVFVVPPPSVWRCHTLITHRLNFDLIDRWLEVKKKTKKKNRSRQFSNGHSVTCSWTCVMFIHLCQAWANH